MGTWIEAAGGGFAAATDPTTLQYTNANAPTYLFIARDIDNTHRVWLPPGNSQLRAANAPYYAGRTLPRPPA